MSINYASPIDGVSAVVDAVSPDFWSMDVGVAERCEKVRYIRSLNLAISCIPNQLHPDFSKTRMSLNLASMDDMCSRKHNRCIPPSCR